MKQHLKWAIICKQPVKVFPKILYIHKNMHRNGTVGTENASRDNYKGRFVVKIIFKTSVTIADDSI
jgi:hypothetical protein